MVGGAGLFLTRYTSEGGPGTVVFPAKLPGNIISVDVTPQQSYFVHRSGFLCGTDGIEASVAMQQKLGGAFLGGMGFFLQHLTGQGQAWLELSGEMFAYDLEAGHDHAGPPEPRRRLHRGRGLLDRHDPRDRQQDVRRQRVLRRHPDRARDGSGCSR